MTLKNKIKIAPIYSSIIAAAVLTGTSSATILVEYGFAGGSAAGTNQNGGTATNMTLGAFNNGSGGNAAISSVSTTLFVRSNATEGSDESLATAITNDAYAEFSFTAGTEAIDLDYIEWAHDATNSTGESSISSSIFLLIGSTGFDTSDQVAISTLTSTSVAGVTVDLSAYSLAAGDTETFRFYFADNQDLEAYIPRLDSLTLAGTIVPEPSSVAFLSLASVAILLRRRK